MDWFEVALAAAGRNPNAETLDRFRASIDPAWIDEALELTGTATLRRRRLPAEQVIWLVIGMALQRNKPIHDVVDRLELALPGRKGTGRMAASSVAEARQRLGEQALRWLFERTAKKWATDSAEKHRWRGLSLFAVDGTTLRVADSDENREHFERPAGRHTAAGYPVARVATVMAIRSHILLDANFGPYRTAELTLAEELWGSLPEASLTILDKLYHSTSVLFRISRGGNERHWLVRVKKNTKWKVLKSLGRREKLVEIATPVGARKKDPSLPESYIARAIEMKSTTSREPQWLLTSLLESTTHPAAELAALYCERWEIEIGYDEIKTHMLERAETLRSRTVEGVHQEIWGILLTYNLVRLEMERVADEAGVPPFRISFIRSLRFIRDMWEWLLLATPGAIPKRMQEMSSLTHFILPERRPRSNPRGVKIFGSRYPKKPEGARKGRS